MSESVDVLRFLQKVPLFQSLNQRQLGLIARRVVEREFRPGEAIVKQDTGGEGFFIIVAGRAQAVRTRADGTQTVVNEFVPTDFFGELALLDDGLRTASVIAVEPTRCLVLTRWDFLAALREDQDMAIVVLQELARRFRRLLESL